MDKPVVNKDQTIKQIIAIRKTVRTKKRTKQVTFLASPEERELIERRFGGPANLRDFALGITDLGFAHGDTDETGSYDLDKVNTYLKAIKQIADITKEIIKLDQGNEA